MTTSEGSRLSALDESAAVALERLSRALHLQQPGIQATLDAIVRSAVATIDPAEHAGVNLVIRQAFLPQAVLGSAPPALDALQQSTGEGPCIEASAKQTVIRIEDMSTETRWPRFRVEALERGVYSMLCVPLWVDEAQLGSLSLYGGVTAGFDAQDERLASLLATLAALALAEARLAENLRSALRNRDVIGQAKGVLMERHRLTADQAFARLSAASQSRNLKLVTVAEEFVNSGELLE